MTPSEPELTTIEIQQHPIGARFNDEEAEYVMDLIATQKHTYAVEVLEGLLKKQDEIWDDEIWYVVVPTGDIKEAITKEKEAMK